MTLTITKGDRKILYPDHHLNYAADIITNFDNYFYAIKTDGKTADFTQTKQYELPDGRMWWIPFLPEFRKEFDLYISEYHPKLGDIILDAGGYSGLTAYWFSQIVGPKGLVIVLEPDTINYDCLVRNVGHIPNIIPLKRALWDSETTMIFQNHGGMGSAVKAVGPRGNDCYPQYNVKTTTIPLLEGEFGRFDFMKFDIENAEWQIKHQIRGPAVIEFHSDKYKWKDLFCYFPNAIMKSPYTEYMFVRGDQP